MKTHESRTPWRSFLHRLFCGAVCLALLFSLLPAAVLAVDAPDSSAEPQQGVDAVSQETPESAESAGEPASTETPAEEPADETTAPSAPAGEEGFPHLTKKSGTDGNSSYEQSTGKYTTSTQNKWGNIPIYVTDDGENVSNKTITVTYIDNGRASGNKAPSGFGVFFRFDGENVSNSSGKFLFIGYSYEESNTGWFWQYRLPGNSPAGAFGNLYAGDDVPVPATDGKTPTTLMVKDEGSSVSVAIKVGDWVGRLNADTAGWKDGQWGDNSLTTLTGDSSPFAKLPQQGYVGVGSCPKGGSVSADVTIQSITIDNSELPEAHKPEPRNYYFSSKASEGGDGTIENPYNSLEKVQELNLIPGDQILLERGSVFNDQYLRLENVQGTADKPIIIDAYGEGDKPLINTNAVSGSVWHQSYGSGTGADGTTFAGPPNANHVAEGDVSSCILLKDVEYLELGNLAMTNSGHYKDGETYNTGSRIDRTGVAGVTQNIGTARGIRIHDLDVHDIEGNVYNKHMCNGGIYFICVAPDDESVTGPARYDGLTVENCSIRNVNRTGISLAYSYRNDMFHTKANIDATKIQTYGNINIVVRNNYLENIGGDGIIMMHSYKPLVEYNVLTIFARDMNTEVYTDVPKGAAKTFQMLAAGIWPWECLDAVFQYNECYDGKANQDGQAWDADWADGTVYQYNYSANNAGGAVMFCGQFAVHTVFRYNISQNDLSGVLNMAENPDGEIYNNVFWLKDGVKVNRDGMSGGTQNISNNIFYYSGSGKAGSNIGNWNNVHGNWSHNLYYNFTDVPAGDTAAVTGDPKFVNGGSGPSAALSGGIHSRDVFAGYQLQDGSPAVNAGKVIESAGGQDFFGNKLRDGQPDIGAAELQRTKPQNFYFSSLHKDSKNLGTEADPYTSLMTVETLDIIPGDHILLERGSVFVDQYMKLIDIQGTADALIIVDAYGDASSPKPIIQTNNADGSVWYQDYGSGTLDGLTVGGPPNQAHVVSGDVSSCILLRDVEYIEVRNLAMTNEGHYEEEYPEYNSDDRRDRTGVAGVNQNIGTADHVYLLNLDVSSVEGNVYNKHMCNGGIYFICVLPDDEAATGVARYNDVLIENCSVVDCNRTGISLAYSYRNRMFHGKVTIADEDIQTYGNTNVVVRGNYLENIGGDGIIMMHCFRPVIERNVLTLFARDMVSTVYAHPSSRKSPSAQTSHTAVDRGQNIAAGIWPWECKDALFQYNECYDAVYNGDGQAWDADSADGTVYQYNYSSNNAGGAIMFCLGDSRNSIFRYNISQNESGDPLDIQGSPNGEIYNNVFWMKDGNYVNRHTRGSAGAAHVYNNIFYYDSDTPADATHCNWNYLTVNGQHNSLTYDHNLYFNFSQLPEDDENAVTGDPLFVNGGSAPGQAQTGGKVYDISVFAGYKLKPGSPAIDVGTSEERELVTRNSVKLTADFFGNPLSDTGRDIGVYEAQPAPTPTLEGDVAKVVCGNPFHPGEKAYTFGSEEDGVNVEVIPGEHGAYTANVTVSASYYIGKVSAHTGEAKDVTFTMTWDGESWQLPEGTTLPVTFNVTCDAMPAAPTLEDVKALLGGKFFTVSDSTGHHANRAYGVLDGGLTLGSAVQEKDGTYTFTATVNTAVYLAQFNKDTGTEHTFAKTGDAPVITLVYGDNGWKLAEGQTGLTFTVTCPEPEQTKPTGSTATEPTQKPETPKTGDETPLAMLAALVVLSMGAVCAIVYCKRRDI